MALLPWGDIPTLLIAAAVFLFVRWLSVQQKRQQQTYGYHRPPGPKGWPLVGNLFLLMKPDKRKVFGELREKYGDLVSLSVGGRPLLIVSGVQKLQEVFVDHGKDFEQRPQVFTVLKVGQGKAVVNSSGEVWKEHRGFLLRNMKQLGIGKTIFEKNVVEEIDPFIKVLESSGGENFDPRYCIQTAISNIICSICFGNRFDYSDPDFKEMLNIFDENMRISGSTSIVNYFPFLESVPGDPFKCVASLANVEKVQKLIKSWISRHKERLDAKNPRDIIDNYILEMDGKRGKGQRTTMDESQLLKFVGDLFVGGTETTATTLRWVLIFLVRHPEIQTEVFEEIQKVLKSKGKTQLSVLDKKEMPYTCAVILESQRLGDIAPFSLPHSNFHSVQLGDYVIPKGSVVIPNVHSVHFDPVTFPEPELFRPERFLSPEGKLTNQKLIMPFFIGSRECPGRDLGKMEIFLFLTSMIHRFQVLPSSTDGLPPLTGKLGITYVPDPHQIRFVKRCP